MVIQLRIVILCRPSVFYRKKGSKNSVGSQTDRSVADNYIWAIINGDSLQVVVVDPGDGQVCLDYLAGNGLDLVGILITHHHPDHTGGVALCKQKYPQATVYGPSYTKQPAVRQLYDVALSDGQQLVLQPLELDFTILHIPGHTLDHICYYGHGWLFCGDTLFAAGCGRVFEGTAEQMYASLCRLAQLPEDTKVFCGHEYTQANLKFAGAADPGNALLQQRADLVDQMREQGQVTLPSTIGIELETNPFLRAHLPALAQSAQARASTAVTDPAEVFTVLRAWKDDF